MLIGGLAYKESEKGPSQSSTLIEFIAIIGCKSGYSRRLIVTMVLTPYTREAEFVTKGLQSANREENLVHSVSN